jgi:hypothetical protein
MISTTTNSGLAKGGLTCKLEALCFYSSSVQVDSFVLRNPPLRQAPKRCSEIPSATSPGGFAVRSPFRDFVHLKVLRNAKHFAKPPGVIGQHKRRHTNKNKKRNDSCRLPNNKDRKTLIKAIC